MYWNWLWDVRIHPQLTITEPPRIKPKILLVSSYSYIRRFNGRNLHENYTWVISSWVVILDFPHFNLKFRWRKRYTSYGSLQDWPVTLWETPNVFRDKVVIVNLFVLVDLPLQWRMQFNRWGTNRFQITIEAEPWKGRSINSIRKSP